MSDLILETLSSRTTPGGQQTLINLTNSLWSTETISTVSVTAQDTNEIDVISAAANGSAVTIGNTTVAIGKGVLLTLNTKSTTTSDSKQLLKMRVVGTEQFKRDYDLIQPVVTAIRE